MNAARRLNARELERAMLARGLQPADLVREAGLSPATVSRMRHGQSVSAPTFRKLVAALERIPVSALAQALTSAEEPAPPPLGRQQG